MRGKVDSVIRSVEIEVMADGKILVHTEHYYIDSIPVMCQNSDGSYGPKFIPVISDRTYTETRHADVHPLRTFSELGD